MTASFSLGQGRFEGVGANTTSAINSQVSGLVSDNQAVVKFVGMGVAEQVEGTAAFFPLPSEQPVCIIASSRGYGRQNSSVKSSRHPAQGC